METLKNTAINARAAISVAGGDSVICRAKILTTARGCVADNNEKAKITVPPGIYKTFSPGEAISAFSADFLSEHVCRMWVLNKLHDTDPPRCPRCGEPVADNLLRSFWENRRVRCVNCRKMFTALTGTFLSGCHMTFREIFLLVVLLSFDLAGRHIAQIMKMSPENVRLWRLKLNQR